MWREGKNTMQLTPIQVECFAGAKADETPRRFQLGSEWIEVEEVVDRWFHVMSQPEWPRAAYFKVRGADQHQYLLKHDEEADQWFLGQRW
jgi:hypothetical protein